MYFWSHNMFSFVLNFLLCWWLLATREKRLCEPFVVISIKQPVNHLQRWSVLMDSMPANSQWQFNMLVKWPGSWNLCSLLLPLALYFPSHCRCSFIIHQRLQYFSSDLVFKSATDHCRVHWKTLKLKPAMASLRPAVRIRHCQKIQV